MQVSVFVPCYIDQMAPQIGIQMILFLEKIGCQVSVNANAFCCGQPAFNAGFQKESKKVCEKFMQCFKTTDYIIIPSASCAGFLKNYAPSLLQNENLANENKKFYELIDFMTTFFNLNVSTLSFPYKVGYHTSCAALREYKTTENTRKLLQQIPDLKLVDFSYSETCCGFGGTFAEKFSDISINMAKHKIEMLEKSGAEYIASNDYSCLFQLKSVAQKINSPLKFIHLIEILQYKNS